MIMEEKRIYIVHIDDIPENESFFDWSDEKVIEVAEKRGTVYSLEGFVEKWNELPNFMDSPECSYMRLLDKPKKIIGYQVYENGEFPTNMPDWWIFKTEKDAQKYAVWNDCEKWEITPIFEGDIYKPEFITFEDYIYSCVVGTLTKDDILHYTKKNNETAYSFVLGWLKDFGILKTKGHEITERILKYYEL